MSFSDDISSIFRPAGRGEVRSGRPILLETWLVPRSGVCVERGGVCPPERDVRNRRPARGVPARGEGSGSSPDISGCHGFFVVRLKASSCEPNKKKLPCETHVYFMCSCLKCLLSNSTSSMDLDFGNRLRKPRNISPIVIGKSGVTLSFSFAANSVFCSSGERPCGGG